MATITIRKLDDATVEGLKARAKESGRSMEEEARRILKRVLERTDPLSGKLPPGQETIALVRELRQGISAGQKFDVVKDLRELRDGD